MRGTRTGRTGGTSGTGRARRRPAVAAVVAAVLSGVLAGCASLGGGTTSSGAGSDGDGGGPGGGEERGVTNEVTGDAPLLQVRTAGGFVPFGYDFRTVPELTLYPDGTAITHGPQILIYPGPALPNLLRMQLEPGDVDAVVDAARDAGLLAEAPDYGQPSITDVGTTTVTLRVDGAEHVHSAYALGLGDPGLEEGLPEDAVAARAALTGFLDEVRGLFGDDGESYRPDRFAVLATPAAEEAMPVDDGIDRQVLPWPVEGVALADAAECVVVDGEDGAALAAALADANQLTVFEQDGTRYEVHPRVLLPHETGCPAD